MTLKSVSGGLKWLLGLGVLLWSMSTVSAQGNFTLTLLHNNDAESKLINAGQGLEDFGGAARFKTVVDQTRSAAVASGDAVVFVTSGDNILPGAEFDASLNRAPGLLLYESLFINSLLYDALCLGNHDFDFGPSVLERLIAETNPTYLSANLDFSNEPGLLALFNANRIAPSTVVTRNGRQIGIIGLTTTNLPTISSPGNVITQQDVVGAVNTQVANLKTQGVNIIILISHLQGISEDRAVIANVADVDIVVAGGGDELLANAGTLLVPGDAIQGPYPTFETDSTGKSVPVVTTAGNLKYLGKLTVDFDAAGNLLSVNATSGPIRVSGVGPDAVVADSTIQADVVDSVQSFVSNLANQVLAITNVDLDGRRSSIRFKESNEGNLIADALLFTANELGPDSGIAKVDIAIANGGGIRNDNIVAAGSLLSEATADDFLPFPNNLAIIQNVGPTQLKTILENAYSRFEDPSNDGTGRFGQIAGIKVVIDQEATAQFFAIDTAGEVVKDAQGFSVIAQAGSRVISATLDDGTKIIENGQVVPGAPSVNIAASDFIAFGGDEYPFSPQPITVLPSLGSEPLANFLVNGLNGTVTAADYPVGGEGRITILKEIKLTLLHNNDAESKLINAGQGLEDFGGAARFKSVVDNAKTTADTSGSEVVFVTSGDNFLPGAEFDASLNRAAGLPLYESEFINLLGYDALCLGNHDFDFGPGVLERLITETPPVPYLSANLDFTNEPGLQALVNANRIAPSTIVEKDGRKIGIIGLTTTSLPSISSPGNVIVGQNLVNAVSTQVTFLTNAGANIIILISHLQGTAEDRALIASISGIDIVVAGGGDELLANAGTPLVPGDAIQGPYPTFETDNTGKQIPVVTTAGNLKYLGRLNATFNSAGEIIALDTVGSGPIRVSGVGTDAVAANALVQTTIVDSVSAFVSNLANQVLAITNVDLDGRRSTIRFEESNEGNLIADALLFTANELGPDSGIAKVDIAIANGGGIRNDNIIAAGSLLSEATADAFLPFPNNLAIIENVAPTQLKTILENAYSRFENPANDGTGRFGQIAGFSVVVDPGAKAQFFVIDTAGEVVKDAQGFSVIAQAGNRIISATLDDGTKIIENGQVVPGAPSVNIAASDFIAFGGDQYPFSPQPITVLPSLGSEPLANFLVNGLNGTVTAADYPFGGEGRITFVSCTAAAGTVSADQDTAFIDPISGRAFAAFTPNGDAVIPTGYAQSFLLTAGSNLTLKQVSPVGNPFQLKRAGEFKVHSLVYNPDPASPDYIDIDAVRGLAGTQAGNIVASLVSQGICFDLDVAGTTLIVAEGPATVTPPTCTADAGTVSLNQDTAFIQKSSGRAFVGFTPNGDAVIPAGYTQSFLLTAGSNLTLKQVSPVGNPFQLKRAGEFTIHSLVYNPDPASPDYIDINAVRGLAGTSAATIVASLTNAGICFDLDVVGSKAIVAEMPANRLSDFANGIVISPNPATFKVFVAVEDAEVVDYELTDAAGKRVATGQFDFSVQANGQIDLSHMAQGIYQLSLKNVETSEVHVEKIVKQ